MAPIEPPRLPTLPTTTSAPPAPSPVAPVPAVVAFDHGWIGQRPRNRRRRLAALALVVVALGIVGAGGVVAYRELEQRRALETLPTVTRTELPRSVVLVESATFGITTRRERIEADLVDGAVRTRVVEPTASEAYTSLIIRGAHLYSEVDGSWFREPLDPQWDADDVIALTLPTIDDVVPLRLRPTTEVLDVRRTEVLGVPVRHFELALDPDRLQAVAATSPFWQDAEFEQAEVLTHIALEVWVDDEGTVYRVRSRSDLSGDTWETQVESMSDAPFAPPTPTEFTDL